MRKVLLAVVICGCTAGFVANAAVPMDRAAQNAVTAHVVAMKTADSKVKQICTWVTKWVTQGGKRVQVRTHHCVAAVRG